MFREVDVRRDSFCATENQPHLRVLIIHNCYQQAGGEDSVYKNEAALLEYAGCDVIRYERTNDEIKGLFGKLKLPFQMFFNPGSYHDVRRIVRDYGIDVVHCHNIFPLISPSVYWAAKRERVPVFQTVHNFRLVCPCGLFYRSGAICEDCLTYGLQSALGRTCYRGSWIQTSCVAIMLSLNRRVGSYSIPHYVFLTEFNRQKHLAFLYRSHADSLVRPNNCNVSRIADVSWADRKRQLLFFGRLSEEKGFKRLLDLWNSYCRGLGLELVIAGTGTLNELATQFASAPVACCQYVGMLDHGRLEKEIASSLAVVIPSLCYEGFPMAIAESFAVGTPVLANDIGNCKEIIESSGGGKLFDIDNELSFLEALADLLENWKPLAENAKTYYLSELRPEVSMGKLLKYYHEVINEQSRANGVSNKKKH